VNTFLTGSSGTIGRNFSGTIAKLNIDLSQNGSFAIPELNSGRFNFIHAAAIVGDAAVKSDIKKAYKINVEATKKIAELCITSDLNKFLYISTSHVYKSNYELISENSEIEPMSVYSEQKRMAELELLGIFKNTPENLIVARVFSILDWDTSEYSLGGAVRKLITGKIESINYGEDIRDFMKPLTVTETISKLILNNDAFGIFNICSSIPKKISSVVLEMLLQVGKGDLVNKIIPNESLNPFRVGSNKKLLDYIPSKIPEWTPSLRPDMNESLQNYTF
jgi:nucleoside-diphosphate-sugar epimerase